MKTNIPNGLVPPSLTGPILVNTYGVPRYWPLVNINLSSNGIAVSTMEKSLSSIDTAYLAFEATFGFDCLDQMIANCDLDSLIDGLQSIFTELRSRHTDKGTSGNAAWRNICSFMKEIVFEIYFRYDKGKSLQIDGSFSRFSRLINKKFAKAKRSEKIRSLPYVVMADIYEIIDPHSDRNPFRGSNTAFRNYVIILFLLHLGLRRAEICLLSADAIRTQLDKRNGQRRQWLNVVKNPYAEEDIRRPKPNLKTPESKRQIPIDDDIAALTASYITNYRGARGHSFLFSSQKGSPISLSNINSILAKISGGLSEVAKAELFHWRGTKTVTPHDLRHTCAVARLADLHKSGRSLDEAYDILRLFFGWSRSSDMPRRYASAYFEDQMNSVSDMKLDDALQRIWELGER